ncbi:MAG: tRNA (N(6)-L-threonylcarbamoyladenosine(37)-C(2))-methylthiotransferase MtaB [Chlamydiales bacterium]|nr:tRNA (N(6)-L-threonylcarbamoyladenosine(37)-C(2))-methylthiotransferase MtaB [Chlamydiales bacterium]
MIDKKRFKVVALGCRTNQYEAAAYVSQLQKLGYEEAKEGEEAELCIVNTCTVTESADSSSRHQIRQLSRLHPDAKLVVTGCLAERLPQEIGQIPNVDLVVSNKQKESLLSLALPDQELPEFEISHFPAHTRAFVKVQDGCNSFCTYCIIPYVRGRSRSRRLEDIMREVNGLIQNGYKEVVLTGINIGDFDGAPAEGEERVRLSTLVSSVDAVEGIKRVRISSIDPDEVDDELLQAVIGGKRTCPSMHVVLQSGSNVVLKRMNRKYTRQDFIQCVEKLRKARPDFTFTTDIIVGFPGETEKDFEETLEVMEEVKFAKVHMFPYSERARTRAALFTNKVPPDVIQERKQRVLRLAEKHAFELRENYIGKEVQVLLESDRETLPGYLEGHTENFLPVFVPSAGLRANDLVTVRCVQNHPQGLIGSRD